MTLRPPPEHVEALRSAAEAILSDPAHCVWYRPDFARKLARAFVWALYTGAPTLEAMARVSYGDAWDSRRRSDGETAFQAWLRISDHGFTEYERRVARLNLEIPARMAAGIAA